jgi:hypothetical protein
VPNKPQFEAFDIMEFIYDRKVKMISMQDICKVFYQHIETTMQYLIEGKVVCMEVPIEDGLYHITKIDSDTYLVKMQGDHGTEVKTLNAIELVNFMFEKAPFISLVGYSNA